MDGIGAERRVRLRNEVEFGVGVREWYLVSLRPADLVWSERGAAGIRALPAGLLRGG